MSVVTAIASIAAGWWLIRLVRVRTVRFEQGSEPVADRVHGLQRLSVSVLGGAWLVFIVASAVAAPLLKALEHRPDVTVADKASATVALCVVMLAALAVLVVGFRRVRRSLARVRDVPLRAPGRRSRVLASLAISVAYAGVLVGGMALVPRHGAGHTVGRSLVYLVAIALFVSVIAPLAIVRFRTTRMPDGDQRRRLQQLATTMQVPVRDFRVLPGRSQRIANAAQMGTLPGLRYVLITDHLLDNLEPQQVDAVVAHELGHARQHHIAIKLAAVAAVWVLLEVLYVLVAGHSGSASAALATVPVLLAIPAGIVLVQGVVGVRLETAADDVAARAVGAQPLAEALAILGRLNDTKGDTGRAWALLTQHPALGTRVARLRDHDGNRDTEGTQSTKQAARVG